MKYLIILLLFLSSISLAGETKRVKKRASDPNIWTGQLVKKPFINKKGMERHPEWYLRMSVKDYYIKMCVSEVTNEQLEELYKDSLSAFTFEVELTKGSWDTGCPGEPVFLAQSRGGEYVILKRLVE